MIKKSAWALLVPGAFFLFLNFSLAHLKYSFVLEFLYLSFLYFLYQVLKGLDLQKHLTLLVGGIASIVFCYGLFQKFITFPYLLNTFEQSNRTNLSASILEIVQKGRVFSIFTLPTLYSFICAILLVYILHCIFIRKEFFPRLFWGILFLLGLFNLILTQSFGGIIYFSAGIICYLLLTRRVRLKHLSLVLMGLVLVFSLIIALRFPEARDLEPVTLRLTSWEQSVRIIGDHPVFGVGLGNFGDVVSRYVRPGEARSIYVHNFFLQLLSETGIFLFLLILIAVLYRIKKNWFWEITPQRAVYISILSSLLVYNLIDIGLYFFSAGLVFAVVLSQIDYTPRPASGIRGVKTALLAITVTLLLLVHWSDSLYHQGNLAQNQDHLSRALERYQKCLRINPFHYRASYEAASCHFRQNRLDRARHFLEKSLTVNPHYPSANYLQSLLLTRTKDLSAALRYARRAHENYPAKKRYRLWLEKIQSLADPRK